jgi:lipoprotein-anchoring transpeptidase ErfK/SrfK
MNNMSCFKSLAIGLVVLLTLAPQSAYTAPLAQDGGLYHTVQAGENLFRISLRYGTTVHALMQANGIANAHRIYVGQRLWIPATGSAAPTPAPTPQPTPAVSPLPTPVPGDPPSPPGVTVHTVQAGENLYRIGLRYGVTAQAIAWANGLPNVNLVYVGQRLTIPAPGSTPSLPDPTPGAAPPSPSATGKQIVVLLSEQRMYAYENGQLLRSTLVSTGLPGTPTVQGNYKIYLKYTSQLMSGPGYYLPNVPYVLYFYKGYSFHGTYWHNNFGRPMSHGCVNMPTPEAAWLYNWAPIGTAVTIYF